MDFSINYEQIKIECIGHVKLFVGFLMPTFNKKKKSVEGHAGDTQNIPQLRGCRESQCKDVVLQDVF